jgi:CRISPR-associated protein Cmr2
MKFDWFTYRKDELNGKLSDCYSYIKLLKTLDDKEKAKEYHKELVHGKYKVNSNKGEKPIAPVYPMLIKDRLDKLNALHSSPVLSTLPPFSFFLEFKFFLETPYLSKDDEIFHICDNPVRKDWVFKVPMVSGSTWKGSLRWAATKHFTDDLATMDNTVAIERRLSLIRLFGAEKEGIEKAESTKFEAYLDRKVKEKLGKDCVIQFREKARQKSIVNKDGFGKGRLHFYPSFFDKIDLEVINPHDRKTKAGTIPVTIESVPVGSTASFRLLYVPFVKTEPKEVLDDLQTVAAAIESMMLTYGFSAKKSSGFGIAKKELSGKGVLKIRDKQPLEFSDLAEFKNAVNNPDFIKTLTP